jgi:hypothetical protein
MQREISHKTDNGFKAKNIGMDHFDKPDNELAVVQLRSTFVSKFSGRLGPHLNGLLYPKLKEQKLWDKYYTEQPLPRRLPRKNTKR